MVNPNDAERALRRWYYLRLIIRRILKFKKLKLKKKACCISDAWIEYSYTPIKGRPGYERAKQSFCDQQLV